jgi:hypothetical protein
VWLAYSGFVGRRRLRRVEALCGVGRTVESLGQARWRLHRRLQPSSESDCSVAHVIEAATSPSHWSSRTARSAGQRAASLSCAKMLSSRQSQSVMESSFSLGQCSSLTCKLCRPCVSEDPSP